MYKVYKDRAEFLFVYIHEAHPSDGWQMPVNEEQGVVFKQPTTFDERRDVATKCCSKLKLSMPTVVDTIDNKTDMAYAAWPERIFIVDTDGKIVYAGGPGPFGFKPEEARNWLKRHLKQPGASAPVDGD